MKGLYGRNGTAPSVSMFGRHAYQDRHRNPPSLPFGWEAITVALVGAALTVIGIVIIMYGMLQFFSGTIGSAIGGDFDIGSFFSGFFGAVMLFVIGGVLAGIGGWLLRLWWIFLIFGAATGMTSSARNPEPPSPDVRVRCRGCGHLNPETATACLRCAQPV